MMEKIEQSLDQQVRPYLHAHGGEVRVKELTEEGMLYVQLLGQCSGCPSNTVTTQNVIQEALVQALPQIKQVVLDQPVDPELLDMARKILRHEL